MGWRIAAGALAVLLCAAADDAVRPVLRPLHDVDVTYVLDAGHGTIVQERMRWDVAARMLRVDPPTRGLYVIIDLAARRMITVQTAEQAVIEMAAPASVAGMADSAAAGAERRGTDTVAGLACTEWDITDAAGQATRVCLTEDGVLLRARLGDRTLLQAETVQYGPIDPGAFRIPVGYTSRLIGPQPAGPPSASSQPASPEAASPEAVGPEAVGPKAMGPEAAGSTAAGPRSGLPQAAGPQEAPPQTAVPQPVGRQPADPQPAGSQ